MQRIFTQRFILLLTNIPKTSIFCIIVVGFLLTIFNFKASATSYNSETKFTSTSKNKVGIKVHKPSNYWEAVTTIRGTVDDHLPVLNSLSINCITYGYNQNLEVRLSGENFAQNARVRISILGIIIRDFDEPITVSTDGKTLDATVPAEWLPFFFPGRYTIQIVNPTTAGQGDVSNPLFFTVYSDIITGNISGKTSVCAGETNVVYSVPAVTDASYDWKLPLGATIVGNPNGNQITVNFNNATSGTISVIASNGCRDPGTESTLAVTVAPAFAVTISSATGFNFCEGGSVTLKAEVSGTGLNYQWQNGTTNIAGATGPTYLATASGNYRVLVSNNTCTTASAPVTVKELQIPTATITPLGPLNICEGVNVALRAPDAPAGDTYTYEWRLNDQPIANATAQILIAAAAGSYKLVVTNTGLCTSTPSTAVEIGVTPAPAAPVVPGAERCGPGVIPLAVTNPQPGLIYRWYDNPAATQPVATGSSYSPNLTSSRTFYVSSLNNQGNNQLCESLTKTRVEARVKPLPTAEITPQLPQCLNLRGQNAFPLNGRAINGTFLRWDIVDGNNIATITSGGNSLTPTVLVRSVGTVRVKLTVLSDVNCGSDEETITLTVNPVPTWIPSASPLEICGPGPITITATGAPTSGDTYNWYNSDGTKVGTGATLSTNIVQTSGTALFYVAAVNAFGCENNRTAIVITINTPPTAVINGPNTFCTGSSALLTAVTDKGTNFTWFRGSIQVGSGSTYRASAPGKYFLRVTDAKNCSSISQEFTLIEQSLITNAILSIGIVENEELNAFTRTVFEAIPAVTGPAYSYRWFVGYGGNPPQPVNESSFRLTLPPDSVPFNVPINVQAVQVAPEGICYNAKQSPLSPAFNLTPLPVELVYLKATKQDNDVVAVEWATAMEQNSEGFEVQVSQDAQNYRTLAFVASKAGGNTNQQQVYTFYDKENGKYGTRYYRLLQRDMNGDSEYFGPKAVKIGEATESLSAYPNPFSSEVTFELNAEESGKMHVLVTNAIGAKVLERTLNIQKGSNKQSLRFNSSLPQGIYYITTRMSGKVQHVKLLKQP